MIPMICLASDHAGYELKEHLVRFLTSKGFEVLDLGTRTPASVNYPEYGAKAGECVASGKAEKGIIVCGTGIGISIAANKVPGIRAALCTNTTMARLAREHNDANILALGSRIIGEVAAEDIVLAFLGTEYSGQERHSARIRLISEIEKKYTEEKIEEVYQR